MPTSDSSLPQADPVEDLLADVVTLPDTEQRAALAQVCADHPQLAAELQARFALFARMARPHPTEAGAVDTPRAFGEYTLLRELGRGGMGVVYLARQLRGEQERLVALKLVHDRLALSPAARERLRREGAAAFRLQHPGICQAYDLGEIDGTPFVSMRYVPGRTLASLLSEARAAGRRIELPCAATESSSHSTSTAANGSTRLRAVLQLVEQVARALHAAHEAGFVHRDVKPSNIMVDNDGAPVLLDFGLVHDAASSHGLTLTDQPLGTPNYMSPEQIAPRGRRVDRTTDVYSVGVMLYELLSGQLPFTGTNREELFQQILTVTPPRLTRRVPGMSRDLDVVVHTALAKDPDRRYLTALALAEDLQRARTAQPIVAQPPGVLGRLALWSRRNPLAAVMLAMLLVSQAFIVDLALRAERRTQEASAARALAEENYTEASTAIEELTTLASEQLSDVPWLSSVRRSLFKKVLAFHERTATRMSTRNHDALQAARAWIRAAFLQEDLGNNAAAETLVQRALEVVSAHSQDPEGLRWSISANLLTANLAQKRGDADATVASLRAAIAGGERLEASGHATADDRRRASTCHFELAEVYAETVGQQELARAAIETCLRISADSQSTTAVLDRSAALRLRSRLARLAGDEASALADLERGVAMLRDLVANEPHQRGPMSNLATSLISQGLAQKELHRHSDALASYEEAQHLYQDLLAGFPLHTYYRLSLGRVLANIAVLHRSTGDLDAATAAQERALTIARAALQVEPDSQYARSLLADCANNLANFVRTGQADRAESLYREGLTHLDAILASNPSHLASIEAAGKAHTSLGALLASQRRFAPALVAFTAARARTAELFAAQEPSQRQLRTAAILDYNCGSLACETGNPAEGMQCLRSAVHYGERALATNRDDPRAQAMLLNHRVRLAAIHEVVARDATEPDWQAAIELARNLDERTHERLLADPASRFDLAVAHRGLATCRLRAGDLPAAKPLLDRAGELLVPGRGISGDVEELLLEHARLLHAAGCQDAAALPGAAERMSTIAQRLMTTLPQSPLQRLRVGAEQPHLLASMQVHGTADQIAQIAALGRVVAD